MFSQEILATLCIAVSYVGVGLLGVVVASCIVQRGDDNA